jgi:hypothetical protein
MRKNLNPKKKLSRKEYKQRNPALRTRLYDLEKACSDNGVPTVIVFEDWDSSVKILSTELDYTPANPLKRQPAKVTKEAKSAEKKSTSTRVPVLTKKSGRIRK